MYSVSVADGNSDYFDDLNTTCEFSNNRNLQSTHGSIEMAGDVEILLFEAGNKIIFQFDELILKGISDPNDIVTLTDGRANFNLETFND